MSLRKKIYSIIPSNLKKMPFKLSDNDSNNLAIVVHTCDNYLFCWNGWHTYFKKYWNLDLPFNIYFVNEKLEVDFEGIKQIKTGPGEWSTRLKKALEIIPEKDILYLQEDVWLQSTIDIKKYYSIFLAYSIDRLQLSPPDPTYTLFSKFKIGNLYIRKFAKRSNYLISHQPSLWKKSFFINCLNYDESPWNNEIEGTKRLRMSHSSFSIYLSLKNWYTAVSRQGKLTQEGVLLEKNISRN